MSPLRPLGPINIKSLGLYDWHRLERSLDVFVGRGAPPHPSFATRSPTPIPRCLFYPLSYLGMGGSLIGPLGNPFSTGQLGMGTDPRLAAMHFQQMQAAQQMQFLGGGGMMGPMFPGGGHGGMGGMNAMPGMSAPPMMPPPAPPAAAAAAATAAAAAMAAAPPAPVAPPAQAPAPAARRPSTGQNAASNAAQQLSQLFAGNPQLQVC